MKTKEVSGSSTPRLLPQTLRLRLVGCSNVPLLVKKRSWLPGLSVARHSSPCSWASGRQATRNTTPHAILCLYLDNRFTNVYSRVRHVYSALPMEIEETPTDWVQGHSPDPSEPYFDPPCATLVGSKRSHPFMTSTDGMKVSPRVKRQLVNPSLQQVGHICYP